MTQHNRLYLSRRSEGHRAGGLGLWYAARLHRDPDRHVDARVQGRLGPCSDQPVRSLSAFPDGSNRTVVGFNVDTLYSLAQLDLSKEPMVLSVPDMGKRFG